MTENNTESGQGPGAVGTPSQPPSGTPGTSPSSVDLKALAEALRPVFAEEVKRSTQSVKDKRIAKLQAQQEELLAKYDDLLKEGLTPAKARRELMIDQLLEGQLGQAETIVPPEKGGTQTQAAGDTFMAGFLKLAGLDANSAEVTSVFRDTPNPMEQIARLTALAQERQKQAQPTSSNPAQVLGGSGGVSVGVTSESLMAEYRNLTKNAPAGEHGIKQLFDAKLAIRKKAAEAGVKSPV